MSLENLDNNNSLYNSPFFLNTDINENEFDTFFYNFYNDRVFDETSNITLNTQDSQSSQNLQNSQNSQNS
jgi:hypothetical protein